ncbi:hypothetical protein [Nostoc sp. DSM 114161]|uniref:hypothetical protein n=1 Tax=Nostoc sp. DSM 114161 TaxID=3440143 RepID=UPI0040455EF8
MRNADCIKPSPGFFLAIVCSADSLSFYQLWLKKRWRSQSSLNYQRRSLIILQFRQSDRSKNCVVTVLKVKVEPQKVKVEPQKVKVEPQKVNVEPQKIKVEPQKVKVEPQKVKVEPQKVKVEFERSPFSLL